MFFTQEDYKKIQQWLIENSVKDTEFNEASLPLRGNEEITIIQGDHNKKMTLKDLANSINLLGTSDFINVSESYNAKYITLQTAISLIPYRARKLGQVITFLNKEGNWNIYQFKGESLDIWNNTTLWVDIIESLYIDSILPDEEDLTVTTPDVHGNTKLKFKDKEYTPNNHSGLGRVYLRKNIVVTEDNSELNILTQTMLSKENTIYIIQYDFNLNGESITIPKGCILDFQGGSLSNGTIIGSDTNIKAGLVNLFIDVIINGTWNVNDIYSKWFVFKEGSQNDNRNQFRNLFALALDTIHNNIYIEEGTYYTSAENGENGFIIPSNTNIYNNANICLIANNRSHYAVFGVYSSENIVIRGGKITGDVENHSGETEWGYGIALKGAKNCTIENIICEKFYGDGININSIPSDNEQPIIDSSNIIIKNVTCDSNARQGMSIEGCVGCIVESSEFINTGNIKFRAPGYGIDLEPWLSGQLVRNVTIINCNISNNVSGGILNYLKDSNANVVIENNNVQSVSLQGCEYSAKIINNIIHGGIYGYSSKGIILDNNTINERCYFEGDCTNNKITNNVITTESESSFSGCIVKNNIINSRIICYSDGAKFDNCIINIQTDNDNSMSAQGLLEFYNCTISINKAIWLNNSGGAIIKNSIIERKESAQAIIIFVSDGYGQDPVKLIANKYINAKTNTQKVQNWGGANPNYIISDIENELATTLPTKPYIGQSYFNGSKPVWWTGEKWVDATGADV